MSVKVAGFADIYHFQLSEPEKRYDTPHGLDLASDKFVSL